MKTTHLCITGDSRKMDETANSSVHLILTSPPYWQLKDYQNKDQIGFNHSYEEYINNLNLVWTECYRILYPGCRLVINIGDQFARAVYYGRYKVIPIRTEIIKFCEHIGFDYMGAIIWQKKTTINTTGGGTVMGSYPFPRNGILEIDYEFILVFKKSGEAPKVDRVLKEQSKISKKKWKEYYSGHWYFRGEHQKKYFAAFPVELPKRIIEMFTFVGETVLDPFIGTGTTALAAKILDRNSIGYEINPDFIPHIKEKLIVNDRDLFEEFEFIEKRQKRLHIKWQEEIKKLPYIYSTPKQFDKIKKMEKLRFGSTISMDEKKVSDKTFFIIKEIIATNLVRLNNNKIIRLIGVKPIESVAESARQFLREKILKRQVYLKFDRVKQDKKNHILAYLYMKNRTFINAHLIKKEFADVDWEFPFKQQNKFLNIIKNR